LKLRPVRRRGIGICLLGAGLAAFVAVNLAGCGGGSSLSSLGNTL